MQVSEQDLKDNFWMFLVFVWTHLGLPKPTTRQREIADFLQHGPKRKLIQAFRGAGKSWISAAYCVWLLWRDPTRKILVVSASAGRAKDFTQFCQRLIQEIDILNRDMFPGPQNPSHRWASIKFDVKEANLAHSASLTAKGITGQITGDRATDIIFDDVEVPDNSLTQDARDKILTKCTTDGESLLIPESDPTITYLGTPQTEESLYRSIQDRGYQARIWPARVPSKTQAEKYQGCLAPSIEDMVWDDELPEDSPTEPTRFNDEYLVAAMMAMGRSSFLLQFMLDTSLSDSERYPLKLSDLIVLESSLEDTGPTSLAWGSGREQVVQGLPNDIGFSGDRWHRPMMLDKEKWSKWDGCIMSIDPSGRGKDETSFSVVAILHGRLFLLDSGGFQGGYSPKTLEMLSRVAKKHQVSYVIVEANYGDGMFTQMLQPILERTHQCGIEEVKHSIQKERRIIDTLEPVLNSHKLIVPCDVIQRDSRLCKQAESKNYSLFYQLSHITKERGCLRQDDRLDALAIAVAYWVDMMSRDSVTAYEDYQNELLEKDLEKHMEAALGKEGWQKQIAPTADLYGVSFGKSKGRGGILGSVLGNL